MSRHDAGRVPATCRWTAVVLLTVLPAVPGAAPAAAPVLCGATLVDDFTLEEDLTCAGTALIVGADGIKIHLQGHTITGNGTGAGLLVTGRTGIRILGGTVVNFMAGVQVSSSTEIEIKNATFRANTDGIDVQAGATGVSIKENKFLDNRARGIMNRSGTSGNEIKANAFMGNRVGILLFGPVGITVKDNYITSSVQFGMRVNFPATGNLIKDNTITSNPSGIDFIPSPTGTGAVGNDFVANRILSNACGLSGPMGGNTFLDNQLIGNTVDVCGP